MIDLDDSVVDAALPDEKSVCTITFARLVAGPHLATTGLEAARRQTRLQQVEAIFETLVFGDAAARSDGQMVAAVNATGRSQRRRISDLFSVATTHANGLTWYSRNPDDFVGLENLLHIVAI